MRRRAPDMPPPDPVLQRRVLLAVRTLAGIVGALFLLYVVGEIVEGRPHVDYGPDTRGSRSGDRIGFEGAWGWLAWGLFKLPPLAAIWLAALWPGAFRRRWLVGLLVGATVLGIAAMEAYRRLA